MLAKAKRDRHLKIDDGMLTKAGQKDVFWTAKQQERVNKEGQVVKMIKDEHERATSLEDGPMGRWKEYFCNLLNEKNETSRRRATRQD